MSARRPFPGPAFTVTPPTWSPWRGVVTIAGVFLLIVGVAILWRATDPGEQPPPQPQSVPAAVVQTVVVTATPTSTVTPTPAPTLLVVTATATPTSGLILCPAANDGDTCLMLAPTATPTSLPPPCADVTPLTWTDAVCRKGDGLTSGKAVTR